MKRLIHLLILWAICLCFSDAGGSALAAKLEGQVLFKGTPPERKQLKFSSDPSCKKADSHGQTSEELIVNTNGTLKNVFVYIKEGSLPDFDVPMPSKVLDQKNCRYVPHVLGLVTGQELEIRNSDATLHNVHALAKKSSPFNIGMPLKGMKRTKTFENQEIMIRLKCNVHPWMTAYVGVLDHSFFDVTNSEGSFKIPGLSEGDYIINIWHETLGTQSKSITVTSSEKDIKVDFIYEDDSAN
jgi:hypothetical protein